MAKKNSRWFPGVPKDRVRVDLDGWPLDEREIWDAGDSAEDDVDWTGFRFTADRTLQLDFLINSRLPRTLHFSEVSDLVVRPGFDVGPGELGWEVIATCMLVADREREDGRLVYALWLESGEILFASRRGFWQPNLDGGFDVGTSGP